MTAFYHIVHDLNIHAALFAEEGDQRLLLSEGQNAVVGGPTHQSLVRHRA